MSLIPLTVALGLHLGGSWALLTPLLLFGLIPLLDSLLRPDRANPEEAEVARRVANPLYDLWLLLWPVAQVGLLAWTLARAADPAVALETKVLEAVAQGLLAGAGGITIARATCAARWPTTTAPWSFDQAPRLEPTVGRSLAERGQVRALGGDVAGAIADWEAALRLDPEPELAETLREALRGARGGS